MSSFSCSDSYNMSFTASDGMGLTGYGSCSVGFSPSSGDLESGRYTKNHALDYSAEDCAVQARYPWNHQEDLFVEKRGLVSGVPSMPRNRQLFHQTSSPELSASVKQSLFTPKIRVVKRRVSANKKERRRTISINTAFTDLRDCIPNVPVDTKLSKIKTLKLATGYISFLMDSLKKNDTRLLSPEDGFQSILNKTLETREDRRKRDILKAAATDQKKHSRRNRTGWPQHVWAQELDYAKKKN